MAENLSAEIALSPRALFAVEALRMRMCYLTHTWILSCNENLTVILTLEINLGGNVVIVNTEIKLVVTL